ncbi:MAG: TetR family transcriptional regulator C-terminal domain-containing protein [Paracoccaceae bacterium]
MSVSETKATSKSTKRNPEHSKKLLISAALDTIAETGIGDTTVTKIIDRAGLSRGMIHLHFGGKSQLLTAAAKTFSEVYYQELEVYVQAAGSDPVAIILSVIKADLSDKVMNDRSTRIWHAFRGAAGTDPGIASFSNTRDKRLREILNSAFMEIANDYDAKTAPQQAKAATYGLLVMLEGMWVDYLANARSFSRSDATAIVSKFIAGLFPNHVWQVK